ncbi:hypothetical protein [Streptomyces sp. NPDC055912]|uniref:hypothetical protein n=1 Tax=Streptomyces sp. NPDC055912 TaxID=3345660 RepID=UPI0035D71A20
MSSLSVPPRNPSSSAWSPPAVPQVLAAVADGRQPPQSAGRGFRVLRALLSLGAHTEHQLADIARVAELQPSHAAKLLKAAALEDLVEHGTRRGTYRLTPDPALLTAPVTTASTTPRVRGVLQHLQAETGLAVAWHEPRCRPGLGLHLDLVDLLCPQPELRAAAAQQTDPRHTAAGRTALAYLPADLAIDAEDRSLILPAATREAIHSNRIALRRCPGICTLATPVLHGRHLTAVLSITGPDHLFQDPLRTQEFAVLLRRAATPTAPSRRTA